MKKGFLTSRTKPAEYGGNACLKIIGSFEFETNNVTTILQDFNKHKIFVFFFSVIEKV